MQNEIIKTDEELVVETLSHKDAFLGIVLRYEAPIRRYVKRLGCADDSDGNDVLQEIFIKVFLHLNDYDPGLKFSSWLYRIAHNETISFLRKKSVRPGVLSLGADDTEIFFEQLANDEDVVELAHKRDDALIVRELLSCVDKKYKDVLILRFLEQKSYTEISDILKIPEGTVATLINRGKKELRIALREKGITHA